MQIHPVGTRALLIDLDGLNQVMDYHAVLSAKPLKNQVDCIAAATTVLLTFETPDSARQDRKSTRLNSSHVAISYAVFCLKKKLPTTRTHLCSRRYARSQ